MVGSLDAGVCVRFILNSFHSLLCVCSLLPGLSEPEVCDILVVNKRQKNKEAQYK